uniref:Uncharacterized protein n=1 Tax=Ceratitis capitata TaxID=7213 RepID=W8C987_CERCA
MCGSFGYVSAGVRGPCRKTTCNNCKVSASALSIATNVKTFVLSKQKMKKINATTAPVIARRCLLEKCVRDIFEYTFIRKLQNFYIKIVYQYFAIIAIVIVNVVAAAVVLLLDAFCL